MKTLMKLVALGLAGGLLVGCGESDQALKPEARKNAAKVWQANSGPAAYVAPGWNVGNEESWQQQLNERTQRGQNEYNRTSGTN